TDRRDEVLWRYDRGGGGRSSPDFRKDSEARLGDGSGVVEPGTAAVLSDAMTPERWSRLRVLFHEAVDLDTQGRQALLRELQAVDGEMAHELATLLDAKTGPEFLAVSERPPEDSQPPVEGRLGAYRLVREIGRGGMGIVFEAVREEDGFS